MRGFTFIIGFCALLLYACTSITGTGSIVLTTEKLQQEGDKYTFNAQVPQLHKFNNPNLQNIVNNKLKKIVERQKDIFLKDIMEVKNFSGSSLKSGLTIMYKSGNAPQDFISIVFVSSSYITGAAHPNHTSISFNYDLLIGKEILLNDLFVPNYLDTLSALTIEKLIGQSKAAGTFYEGKEEIITSGAAPLEENYRTFSIEDKQLVLHFDPYQVGPYAEGIQTVSFSEEELDHILSGVAFGLME